MKKTITLAFVVLFAGCVNPPPPTISNAAPAPASNAVPYATAPPAANASPEPPVDLAADGDGKLIPVTPIPKLDAERERRLREQLPDKVRRILERATRFEVLARLKDESDANGQLRDTFHLWPNRVYRLESSESKREVLTAFYEDVGTGGAEAACFEPHHGLRAYYGGEMVEIEICFECSGFRARLGGETFSGAIADEGNASKRVLNDLIVHDSVPLKPAGQPFGGGLPPAGGR